jgi:hypothetical protein
MRDKRLATAVATLLAAFATAHLMQFGLSAGRLISGDGPAAPIGLATLVARQGGAAPSAMPDGPGTFPAAVAAAEALPLPPARELPTDAGVPLAMERAAGNVLGQSCERSLTAEAAPGAVMRMEVRAPCDPGVRVEIRHAGLRFAVETGADGAILAEIPAMVPDAEVEARFADGSVLGTRVAVPDTARFERVAVVAEGWAGLTLHAYEFGARRGAQGHVHAGAAHVRAGALARLGDAGIDAPLVAEVYTLASGRFGSLGSVRLEVEAVVTPANCARDLAAEVLRSTVPGHVERFGLSLSMPSCAAAGEVLVLELGLADLHVAGK